jgi:hypothetical protein
LCCWYKRVNSAITKLTSPLHSLISGKHCREN